VNILAKVNVQSHYALRTNFKFGAPLRTRTAVAESVKLSHSVIRRRRSVGVEPAAASHPRPPVDRLLQSRTEDLPV